MKYFALSLIAVLISGCAGPQLTKHELDEKEISGLNVYADNMVAIYIPDDSRYGNHIYAWSKNPNKIIAFSINGVAYNLKDIRSISFEGDRKEYINVKFLDGRIIKSPNYVNSPATYSHNIPKWLLCDTSKKCSEYYYFISGFSRTDSTFPKNAEITGVHERHIGKYAKTEGRNLVNARMADPIYFMEDFKVLPTNARLMVLNEEEKKKLKSDVELGLNAAAAYKAKEEEARKQEAEANRQAEDRIQKDSVKMRKTIKIGTETNCGQVFDVRPPMAGVQTINGMHFIAIDKLYIQGAGCRFLNGQYIGR